MKVFNEEGSFMGEFIEASSDVISGAKDTVCDMADVSLVLGIISFILAPGVTLVVLCVLFVFHLFISIIKLGIRAIWWIIRLPFTLIFSQEFPEF